MIKIKAFYYDGRSSAQIPVSASFDISGVVKIEGKTLNLTTSFDKLSVTARLGNTRRSLFLEDGAKLETEDNDAIDRICRQFAQGRWQAVLHRIEQHWLYVFLALAISVLSIWASIEYGVPVAAKWAAKSIPRSVEEQIGVQALANLDDWLFDKSNIDIAKQKRLQQRFSQIASTKSDEYRYRLLLRDGKKLGANAMALPGGIIIATDALVELAENDEQLLATFAHEMGHVVYQHGIRSLLQDSMTAVLMIGLLGDISSISSLSATLPTVLVESRYSRQFEQEADRYAIERLHEQQIDTKHFVRILTLLKQSHHSDTELEYLSTHPNINKRIELIKLHSQ